MGYALGFVLVAFGASLLYKGYRGWSWSQFYGSVFSGAAPSSSASPPSRTVTTTGTPK